jgi:hypothetical protein
MLAINFVGRHGTREEVVEGLKGFLVKPESPGYVSIWGAHGVGKTAAVDYALDEAEKLSSPSRIFIHKIVDYNYQSLDPIGVAHSIADSIGIPKWRFPKRDSLDKNAKNWDDAVDWIDRKLGEHGRGASSVVICLAVSELDESHARLAKLFKANLGRTATRKLILEEQKPNRYLWNVPQPFHKDKRKLGALSEEEAYELLSNLLRQILNDPVMIEAARARILNLCGTHPGLIVAVCEHWESNQTPGRAYGDAQEMVKALDDMINGSYEDYFLPSIRLFIKSLAESSRISLAEFVAGQRMDLPDDIRDAGVITSESRAADLVERYFKGTGMQGGVSYDAFISYNHKDKGAASQIVGALRLRKVITWFDDQLLGGEMWLDSIENAISASACTVVLVSSDQLGDWQRLEVALSLIQRKNVIPVILQGGTESMPSFLGLYHRLDFRNGFSEDHVDSLAKAIRNVALERTGSSAQNDL